MTTAADSVYQAALKLGEAERADLAAKLIESIDPGADADWAEAWDAEIGRRLEELDQGKVKAIPWLEVRQNMVRARRYSFKQLMAGVTDDNIHAEVETGPAREHELR